MKFTSKLGKVRNTLKDCDKKPHSKSEAKRLAIMKDAKKKK